MFAKEMQEIDALYELVTEFREGKAFVAVFEAGTNRIARHHGVNAEMFAEFTKEIDKGPWLDPIGVVEEGDRLDGGGIKSGVVHLHGAI